MLHTFPALPGLLILVGKPIKLLLSAGQERDEELQGLQQKLAEAEEAHEEELLDMQATVKSCTIRLQDTKVRPADSITAGSKLSKVCPALSVRGSPHGRKSKELSLKAKSVHCRLTLRRLVASWQPLRSKQLLEALGCMSSSPRLQSSEPSLRWEPMLLYSKSTAAMFP